MTRHSLQLPLLITVLLAGVAHGQDKPNILIIWGDDIGPFNVSAYNMGVMGYKTPNIDRIAREGIIFTDSYGDQSCTAVQINMLLIVACSPLHATIENAYTVSCVDIVFPAGAPTGWGNVTVGAEVIVPQANGYAASTLWFEQ